MAQLIALKDSIEMDIDYANAMLDEACDNYRADPSESTWEMVKMWQDIVEDLLNEMGY